MSITVDGNEYALNVDGYDLSVIFRQNIVKAGQIAESVFNANVVNYHSDETFRGIINSVFDEHGEGNYVLIAIAFGGPGAAQGMADIYSNNGAPLKGAKRETARRKRAWQSQLIEALVVIGHDAMRKHFDENRDELMESCGVPVDDRKENYEDMLIATGRGTLSYKVSMWEGEGATNKTGSFPISLAYRMDANNKGRAKKSKPAGASTNGVTTQAQATAK
jgi:hypothetical protein